MPKSLVTGLAPIGSVMMWPLSTPHDDYLEMNGASLSTTTYADLFAVIGYTYGGSGASFNIPDYRGYFPRGWDNTAGNDPDAASRTDRGDGTTGDVVGSKQADGLKDHNHDHTANATWGTGGTGTGPLWSGEANVQTSNVVGTFAMASGTDTGDTRPLNVSVMFCIKYK